MKPIRTLIIDDNPVAVDNLKDKLKTSDNIRISGTFTNGEDALAYIINHNYEIDVILMELLLPRLDGVSLLEELKSRNIKTSVIVLSSYKNDTLIRERRKYNIINYILKPFNPNSLEKRIVDSFVKDKVSSFTADNIYNEINNVLHNLGIPSNLSGFRYIRDSVFMYYNTDKNIQITKEVYPVLAEKYDTTPTRIERSIRHAIEVGYLRGDINTIEEIFGYSINMEKSKPTNSEFIQAISDKLKVDFGALKI